MPKSGKNKYYAVSVGRGGPGIYRTWDECQTKVTRFPGAVHRSFTSRVEAENWLLQSVMIYSSKSTPPEEKLEDVEIVTCSTNTTSSQSEDGGFTENDDFVPPSKSEISLSPEQTLVLNRVKDGRSVFFTGSAGTGKSVLLREIIRVGGGSASRTLGVTASTGIASVNIGGATLHSWAGIGLGQEPVKNYVGKFFGQKKFGNVLERWRQVQTLIVDEISMIDGNLFDKLESMARQLRHDPRPFGGIQLVLSGDFCQLPPVPGRDEKGKQIAAKFAFDAESWNACVGPPITLTRVFRQKDQAFVNMLNAMRFGRLDPKTIEVFKSLSRKVIYTDGIEPTELFSTRLEVDNANLTRLRQLDVHPHTYEAVEHPGIDSNGKRVSIEAMGRLLERLIVPKSIQLKVGAQVMLVKNLIPGELVNGSVGQIVRFRTSAEALKEHTEIAKLEGNAGPKPMPSGDWAWPVVRFISGREMMCTPHEFTVNNADGGMEACRNQLPLILAWALSVHKSQGQTLDRVKVDLKRTFEKGQAYVALSRATSMEHLQVLNFDPARVVAHPRVLAWHDHDCEPQDMYLDDDDIDDEEAMSAYYMT